MFALQTECTVMQTKGGYNENEIHSHLNLIDLPKLSWHHFRSVSDRVAFSK